MKKITICSKFDYWLGVIVFSGLLIFCLVIFEMIDMSTPDGEILFYILLIFSTIVFLQAFYFFSRNVYASIDLERNQFIYGNVFFNQETSMIDVKYVKKSFLKKAMIFEIAGKRHRVFVSRGNRYDEVRQYFSE
jgi:hypothetical protein